MRRGDVHFADLDPVRGSEQAGRRPVVVVQCDTLNAATNTVVIVPFTSKLKYSTLPSAHLVRAGDGGLESDSVALCHQIRVLSKDRLSASSSGSLAPDTMRQIDAKLAYVLSIGLPQH